MAGQAISLCQAPVAAAEKSAEKVAKAAETHVAQTEQPRAAETLSGHRSAAGVAILAEADEKTAGGGTEKPCYSSDAATHPFAVEHGSSPTAATRVQSAQDAYCGDGDILQDELVNAISPEQQSASPAGNGLKKACVMHAPRKISCSCCDLCG